MMSLFMSWVGGGAMKVAVSQSTLARMGRLEEECWQQRDGKWAAYCLSVEDRKSTLLHLNAWAGYTT
jgi:hypothetical protein